MKIAMAANGNDLKSLVTEEFEQSEYLLIVELDDLSYEYYVNDMSLNNDGIAMAKKIIECDCEALITGNIEQKAFDELATAQVTRYYGPKHNIKEALVLMEAYKLDIIRDYKGGEGISDRHHHEHHDACDCGEHDE